LKADESDLNTANGNKLCKFCNTQSQNLHYLTHEPTWLTATIQTILDKVITNAHLFVSSAEISSLVSTNDHCTVSAQVEFSIQNDRAYFRYIWLFKQTDFDDLRVAIVNADFDFVFDNDNVDGA